MNKGFKEPVSLKLINRASFPTCCAKANDKSCEEKLRPEGVGRDMPELSPVHVTEHAQIGEAATLCFVNCF